MEWVLLLGIAGVAWLFGTESGRDCASAFCDSSGCCGNPLPLDELVEAELRAEDEAKRRRRQARASARNPRVKKVILDALNICYWGQHQTREPDIRVLLTLCMGLRERDIDFVAYFDATTIHKLRERRERDAADAVVAYETLTEKLPSFFREVQKGTTADASVLQEADNSNSCVVSMDQFREYSESYPWIASGKRLITGAVARKKLTVPQFGMNLPVVREASNAAEELVQLLSTENRRPGEGLEGKVAENQKTPRRRATKGRKQPGVARRASS